MKNISKISLIFLSFLTGCASTTSSYNTYISNTETYSLSLSLESSQIDNSLTKEENIKNYFLTYGSYDKGNKYSFLRYFTIDNKDFRVNLIYDKSRKENPYLISSEWDLDDQDKLPNAYYYFSAYFNMTNFKDISFVASYCYDYEKDKEEESSYVNINYSNLVFDEAPLITYADFEIGKGTSMPSRAVKSNEEIGNNAFETIKIAASFLDTFLKSISNEYSVW